MEKNNTENSTFKTSAYFSRQNRLYYSHPTRCLTLAVIVAIVTALLILLFLWLCTGTINLGIFIPLIVVIPLNTSVIFYRSILKSKRPVPAEEILEAIDEIQPDDSSGNGVRFIRKVIDDGLVLRQHHISKAFRLVNEHMISVEKEQKRCVKDETASEIMKKLHGD